MSSFHCPICQTALIDTPNGYITECEHYPIDRHEYSGTPEENPSNSRSLKKPQEGASKEGGEENECDCGCNGELCSHSDGDCDGFCVRLREQKQPPVNSGEVEGERIMQVIKNNLVVLESGAGKGTTLKQTILNDIRLLLRACQPSQKADTCAHCSHFTDEHYIEGTDRLCEVCSCSMGIQKAEVVVEKGCNLTDPDMPCFCSGHNCTPGVCADCTYPSQPQPKESEEKCNMNLICHCHQHGSQRPCPNTDCEALEKCNCCEPKESEDWENGMEEGCDDATCCGLSYEKIKFLKSRWQSEAREEERRRCASIVDGYVYECDKYPSTNVTNKIQYKILNNTPL